MSTRRTGKKDGFAVYQQIFVLSREGFVPYHPPSPMPPHHPVGPLYLCVSVPRSFFYGHHSVTGLAVASKTPDGRTPIPVDRLALAIEFDDQAVSQVVQGQSYVFNNVDSYSLSYLGDFHGAANATIKDWRYGDHLVQANW